ncbi:MAG TPA: gluconokinase, partial [Rhodanobacteraceae bacterium]|nr:gluconokinase [Rhodanobacteraceae bacterium]
MRQDGATACPLLVVMGVSGSGKTTVGRALAARLGWIYREGDDFHPPANVAKMRAGRPLDDADRAPWL